MRCTTFARDGCLTVRASLFEAGRHTLEISFADHQLCSDILNVLPARPYIRPSILSIGSNVAQSKSCEGGMTVPLGNAIVYCVALMDDFGNRVPPYFESAVQLHVLGAGAVRIRAVSIVERSLYFHAFWFHPHHEGTYECIVTVNDKPLEGSRREVKLCGPKNRWIIPVVRRMSSSERGRSLETVTANAARHFAGKYLEKIVLCQSLGRALLSFVGAPFTR